jgi:cephalosporin hydroxylase
MSSINDSIDEYISNKYIEACYKPSDINELVPDLYKYAKECQSIIECGVSEGNSSWGLFKGLCDNSYENKTFVQCDLPTKDCQYEATIKELCKMKNINHTFYRMSDLDIVFEDDVRFDLTFIDTWHIYGQLKRELNKYAPITTKYILMHDTQVDGEVGESIRACSDMQEESRLTGIPVEEIAKGLRYAIEEFLQNHPEWRIDLVKHNNNGIVVLKRIN